PGLDALPLELGGPLGAGDPATVGGFPYGGPFAASPAEVLALSVERMRHVYGDSVVSREDYTLAVYVEPGTSRAPLLDEDGEIAGIVFAQAADGEPLGDALGAAEVAPVAEAAAGLSAAVSSGGCLRS